MIITGTINLRTGTHKYCNFVNENQDIFIQYLGYSIYPGSLNITIDNEFIGIDKHLDNKEIIPNIIIPINLFKNQPLYLSDLQIWKCTLVTQNGSIPCFLARRIGSRVPNTTLEIISPISLVKTYNLIHNDKVKIYL